MPLAVKVMLNKDSSARFSYFLRRKLEFLITEHRLVRRPRKETSWRRRNDVLMFVPKTLQVRLKWNTKWSLGGKLPKHLSGTSPPRTARKTIFPKSWNITKSSKIPRKYQLSINFLDKKKTAFPISEKFKTRTFPCYELFLLCKIHVFVIISFILS